MLSPKHSVTSNGIHASSSDSEENCPCRNKDQALIEVSQSAMKAQESLPATGINIIAAHDELPITQQ